MLEYLYFIKDNFMFLLPTSERAALLLNNQWIYTRDGRAAIWKMRHRLLVFMHHWWNFEPLVLGPHQCTRKNNRPVFSIQAISCFSFVERMDPHTLIDNTFPIPRILLCCARPVSGDLFWLKSCPCKPSVGWMDEWMNICLWGFLEWRQRTVCVCVWTFCLCLTTSKGYFLGCRRWWRSRIQGEVSLCQSCQWQAFWAAGSFGTLLKGTLVVLRISRHLSSRQLGAV